MKHGAILLVGVLVAAGCARLGVWQLSRLGERRSANARAENRRAASPVVLGGGAIPDLLAIDSLDQRRARAHGRFDFERQIVVVFRTRNGVPGVHLVTPLLLSDSTAVLVERGWLPSFDGRRVEPSHAEEPDSAVVEGYLLRAPPARNAPPPGADFPIELTSPDPKAVAGVMPYQVFPLTLRRTVMPQGFHESFRTPVDPPLTEGSHLSYVVQWFAFATIALVGSLLLYRKQKQAAHR